MGPNHRSPAFTSPEKRKQWRRKEGGDGNAEGEGRRGCRGWPALAAIMATLRRRRVAEREKKKKMNEEEEEENRR